VNKNDANITGYFSVGRLSLAWQFSSWVTAILIFEHKNFTRSCSDTFAVWCLITALAEIYWQQVRPRKNFENRSAFRTEAKTQWQHFSGHGV